ncbi:MAG: hypothetical protein V2I62_04035 [Bacteroidales bacterium]|jgi:hypothetical protein|nr:hypothetical protein [Bacteroidales bacterium]
MKKVILLLLIAATIVSCKKNETTQPDADQYAEVSFNVTTLVPDGGREWVYDYDVPECVPDAIPGWALMKITDADGNELEGDGEEGPNGSNYFKVLVFYTNGELYTQSVKLPVTMCDDGPCCDTYFVTEFFVYDETGVPYKAAPATDSEFFQFVTQTLPVELEICAFDKKEFYIDVLCFTPDYYELFGFFWFEITEITVREVCFFGDVCIDWWMESSQWHENGVPLWVWDEHTNTYQMQQNGIQMDMPAIFALTLYKYDEATDTWNAINSWSNETWYGEGEPLCFRYADYDAVENEQFAVALYIYGPWYYVPAPREEIFGYTLDGNSRDDLPGWATGMPQHMWYFTDNALEDLDLNGDGVIEFAWGDCVEDPEYHLPETTPGK